MNVDTIIARIPSQTADGRSTTRVNAMKWLGGGTEDQKAAAAKVIAALDAFEAAEVQGRRKARAARMAELENSTDVERIIAAFQDLPPTATEEKLIRVLLDHPGGACADLSVAIGWDPVAWDMRFGAMCSKRLEWLWPLEPSVREEKDGYIRLLTVQQKCGDQPVRYRMRPEAVSAFAILGIGGKQ